MSRYQTQMLVDPLWYEQRVRVAELASFTGPLVMASTGDLGNGATTSYKK